MIVYRIAHCSFINDLTGRGAATYGGRWNSVDTHILYTAQSRALALLEAVAHLGRTTTSGYCIADIEIPDSSIAVYPADQLPAGWQTSPPPDHLKAIGDRFVSANKYLALAIPSVLMAEENNYLLNPSHRLFSSVRIIAQRPLNIDQRLFPA
jgi:RES domain-containing protein